VKFLKDFSCQRRRLVHTESEQAEFSKRIQAASNEVIDNLLLDPSNESVTAELKAVVKEFRKPEDFVAYLKAVAFRAGILKKNGYDVGHMFKKPVIRVAVTGAAGNIGYSLIPRIASGEVFGYDQPLILNLIELENAMKPLEGVAMELQDCAFNLLRGLSVTSDATVGFKDIDYAFLVGAKPRGRGMERRDLLNDNANIFSNQGKALNDNAKHTCRVLVVGNPANTNTLIASSNAPNIPKQNFQGMMRLDQNRAIAQLALKLKVDVSAISNVVVWGNHSSTQVPDITFAEVTNENGEKANLSEFKSTITDEWIFKTFIPTVQTRGAAIIAARQLSSAFSAADAAVKQMQDWVHGSNGRWSCMSVPSDGTIYDVPKGLYFSFPLICNGLGKYEVVKDLQLTPRIKEKIEASVKELQAEKNDVARHLLVDRFK